MRVILTLRTGEHVTGELEAVEVHSDYVPHVMRVHVSELEAVELDAWCNHDGPAVVDGVCECGAILEADDAEAADEIDARHARRLEERSR